MERESRYHEFRFSGEANRQERSQTGRAPGENTAPKINAIRLELAKLDTVPVIALLIPVAPEKPEEPEERKKTLPEKILAVIEWVIRSAKRAVNPSTAAHIAT